MVFFKTTYTSYDLRQAVEGEEDLDLYAP